MIIAIIYFIIGLTMLYFGADYLIKNGKEIAFIFNISPIVVGITVVAFGTSLPEMLVSVIANMNGDSDIALGNIIGSNISNIGLVLGLTALIKPISSQYQKSKFDLLFLCLISAMFVLFCNYGVLNRFIGLFFIICLIIYLKLIISRKHIKEKNFKESSRIFTPIILIILSSFMLYLGTEYFIKGAEEIASILGIDSAVVGLTIIAFGTSAPELSASFISIRKQDFDMIIGNIIGSNIFNILAVLGITASIKPIVINSNIISSLNIFLFLTFLLIIIIYFNNKINRITGLIFCSIYVFFLYQSFYII